MSANLVSNRMGSANDVLRMLGFQESEEESYDAQERQNWYAYMEATAAEHDPIFDDFVEEDCDPYNDDCQYNDPYDDPYLYDERVF